MIPADNPRIYDASPLRGGGTEDEQLRTQARKPVMPIALTKEEENPTLRKWITLWRSIVLSTLGLTYLPYYSYIRYLDLDDLGNLLVAGPSVKEYGLALKSQSDIHSELYTPELLDFVSSDYVAEGNKRRRSPRTLPDNDWIKVKLGSGMCFIESLPC